MNLNIGSGQRKFMGDFINVDVQAKWTPDVIADGAHMPMFMDSSAEIIVIHHCLEHFGCGEGNAMIRECYRILKPEGSLIVTVPDFPALCKAWIRGQLTDQVFFTNVYGAYMGDEADRHKWGFTGPTLAKTLDDALGTGGEWNHIRTFDNRAIPGADIAMDFWICAVEAIK
jgi:SAM-dependent methyltransferase